MLAAIDGGTIVGGAGAFTFRMTVPGGAQLGTAGVTVVGVLPTHRRRGILRSMMRAQLDDIHERGEPLAALWASEETIYGRYGYGLASLALEFGIPRIHGAFREGIEPVGRVRLVDQEEAAGQMPPVYDAVQRLTPGMYERSASWWEFRLLADPPEFRFGGGPKQLAVLEVDGRPQAYAIYRLNAVFGSLGPETTIVTLEVVGATPAATASIWRYLLDIDWTQTVSARLQPVDSPLFLLLARPNFSRPVISDGLWIRLVDVGAALAQRAYAGDGGARPRRPRRVLPVERGLLAGRAGRGGAHHRRGRSRARGLRSRGPLPGRVHLPRAPARRPRAGAARRRGRPRGRALPLGRGTVVPRDLLVRAELGRPHHQHAMSARHEDVRGDVVVEKVRQEWGTPSQDSLLLEARVSETQIPGLQPAVYKGGYGVDPPRQQRDRGGRTRERGRTGLTRVRPR